MQPKAKFLTVVWGKAYIERFCALSLPSFLAPGNLPSLAQATELEVVIMTRRDDFVYFQSNLSFKRLSALCPVRFVEIDDLIATAVYGVTLTLAYARPIIACGDDMLNIHFVFMNADFVLADGSLNALCKHIRDGRSIVLAPSFRSTVEEVEPKLEAAVDTSVGVLNIYPRKLVELSIASPHRTTVAKTYNQKVFHSTHPNQFFWQVDQHTVLGRYFLIFMLCLKPERVIQSINSYCDYSFIPEMCPSGDEVVMNDSDDFFMLELQEREQETHMLRYGEILESTVAHRLQEWTTNEHRRAAGYDIVFHSRDIPFAIEAAKAEAQSFISRIKKKLGSPKSHINHKYWIWGVDAWKGYRQEKGLSEFLPELEKYDENTYFRLQRNWKRLVQRVKYYLSTQDAILFGSLSRTILSPYWEDFRLLRETANAIISGSESKPALVIGCPDGQIADLLGSQPQIILANEKDLDVHLSNSSRVYSQILFCSESFSPKSTRLLIEYLFLALAPQGILYIFLNSRVIGNAELARLLFGIGDIFGDRFKSLSIQSVGGVLMRFNFKFQASIINSIRFFYHRFGLVALFLVSPVFTIGLSITMVSMLISNLYSNLRRPSKKAGRNFSSAVIRAQLW